MKNRKKCKLEEGLLTCCDDFHREITRSFQSEEYFNTMYRRGYISECPHCGVRIDKPEPEVRIKKSGGTWVARYAGVDYLSTESDLVGAIDDKTNFFLHQINTGIWKPISEIEITDEIAKLRPMVVINCGKTFYKKLIHIFYDKAFYSYCPVKNNHANIEIDWAHIFNISLATVSDLEEK